MGHKCRSNYFCRTLTWYQGKLHRDDTGETRKVRESQRGVTEAERSGSLIFPKAVRRPVWLECGAWGRQEWPKRGGACGFGARKQFLRGWDSCAQEGGLPSNGEGNNQFRKNILVFGGRLCWREREPRFAIRTT